MKIHILLQEAFARLLFLVLRTDKNNSKGEAMRYKGQSCWKSSIEYNPEGRIRGTPYFVITKDDDDNKKLYLYEYDIASEKYVLLMETDRPFVELHEIGKAKADTLREELIRRGELFTITWEPAK